MAQDTTYIDVSPWPFKEVSKESLLSSVDDVNSIIGNSLGRQLNGNAVQKETITSTEVKELTAGKLTAGAIAVGQDITSTGFSAGSAGWRIQGDGNAEFNNGYFRGTVTAGSIHIPDLNTTANSMHVEADGDTWWGCTQNSFTSNNENAVAYILKNGNAKFGGTLNVYGTTRLNDTLTLGSTTLQRSGKLVLEYYPSEGDTYIRCGKTDYGDNTNGFIIGIDQSDSGGVKAEFGDASNYVKILPTGIFIRSNNADLTGSSTIAGKLTTVLIAQIDTKEELVLRNIDGIEEEEITRADGTVVDIVQSMPSTGTPVYITDYSLYGKDITKDIVFEFEYSMSTSETAHVVKLQCDYNVIAESASVKPAAYTGTVTQEFTVLNDGDYKEILETVGGTLIIPHTDLTASTNLVQIRISRLNTGTSGTNHGGSFRLHRVRAYMVTPS